MDSVAVAGVRGGDVIDDGVAGPGAVDGDQQVAPVRGGPSPSSTRSPNLSSRHSRTRELATTKSNAEIASEFCVSANTIKAHVKFLLRELDVTNRRSAVRPGRELRLIA